MEDFETALSALVDSYRNKANKYDISKILVGKAEIIEKDEGWIYDDVNPQPVSPTLTSISPDTAVLGDPDVTMVCTGTDFSPQSVITFAGQDEPIEFISDTEISTVVKPSLGWGAGAQPVTVKNGTLESDPIDFTFTDPV
jgi:hypothetical protein